MAAILRENNGHAGSLSIRQPTSPSVLLTLLISSLRKLRVSKDGRGSRMVSVFFRMPVRCKPVARVWPALTFRVVTSGHFVLIASRNLRGQAAAAIRDRAAELWAGCMKVFSGPASAI